MKTKKNKFISVYFLCGALALASCDLNDESLAVAPTNFKVDLENYNTIVNDTFVVDVMEPFRIIFENSPNQILCYTGELGSEYRFASRSCFSSDDNVKFENKIEVSTSVDYFKADSLWDYSFYALKGLTSPKLDDLLKASEDKINLITLRKGKTNNSNVTDRVLLRTDNDQSDLLGIDLSYLIIAKSEEANVNRLRLKSFAITTTEWRDYGYNWKGISCRREKSRQLKVLALNDFKNAQWGYYSPKKTVSLRDQNEVETAPLYGWSVGEYGKNYTPKIYGDTLGFNDNGVRVSSYYEFSVATPSDSSKFVAGKGTESWLVSRQFNSGQVLNDRPTVIKKVDQSSTKFYQYIYKETGCYTLTVVGSNTGTNGALQTAKSFVIIVKNPKDKIVQ